MTAVRSGRLRTHSNLPALQGREASCTGKLLPYGADEQPNRWGRRASVSKAKPLCYRQLGSIGYAHDGSVAGQSGPFIHCLCKLRDSGEDEERGDEVEQGGVNDS